MARQMARPHQRSLAQAVSVAKPAAAATYNAQALAYAVSSVAGAMLVRAALLANAAALRNTFSKLAARPAVEPLGASVESPFVIDGAYRRKGSFATARAPSTFGSGPYAALPSSWLVVTSAAHWFEQHRLAAASGALLATVFISDAAARDQGSLLERLRRTYGGESGPVRFVFVHVGAGYVQRSAAASRSAAAAGLRGREALTDLGRASHVAALHGLDVALGSFLPSGGLRAVPSMLLARPGVVPAAPVGTAGSGRSSVVSKEDADEHPAEACWAAASRTGELRQLVSDWAFINTAFARAAAAASTGASMAANNAASSQTCRGHGAVADANSNIVPFHATSACACRLPHTGDTAA
ncbi:hypothetical protein HYH02_006750 [Chlamydomonas schloesseri]|uniref:Uncharacterized protein n=1 Tax=Chlamydomonas schloesseri TaxID=2026947 RepID=A0A835WIP2_9CHLO|nr:hypothetical protein HYH02_006750 [Chlamydomonas schloesseri]|eukprot:KAG2448165.1 hypothetical protein HYH02_006750 [Chlamydomonas schloesseri]